MYVSWF